MVTDGASESRKDETDGAEFAVRATSPYHGNKALTITQINRLQQRTGSPPVVYGTQDTVRPRTA